MKLGTFEKQPAEKKWVSINYEKALDDGDSIIQIDYCTAEPAGLILTTSLVSESRGRIFVENGADGTTYKITTRVTTNNGEVFEDELTCKVKEL